MKSHLKFLKPCDLNTCHNNLVCRTYIACFAVQNPAWGIQFFAFFVLTFLLQVFTGKQNWSAKVQNSVSYIYLSKHRTHLNKYCTSATETYNNISHALSLFPPIESKYMMDFLRKSTTWKKQNAK